MINRNGTELVDLASMGAMEESRPLFDDDIQGILIDFSCQEAHFNQKSIHLADGVGENSGASFGFTKTIQLGFTHNCGRCLEILRISLRQHNLK